MRIDPEQVLEFWFAGVADDPAAAMARNAFWFGGEPETDRMIREGFAPTVEAARRGECADWRSDARSALALVIVLDQFPLNAWRGTAKALAYGEHALDEARRAVAARHLARLAPVEATFLILPYQHSESIEDQRESVDLAAGLLRTSAPVWRPLLENYLAFAQQHRTIIERFGRFPHRNRALGRPSTNEEQAYLTGGGATFGQG